MLTAAWMRRKVFEGRLQAYGALLAVGEAFAAGKPGNNRVSADTLLGGMGIKVG